jgi:hypothetical protein
VKDPEAILRAAEDVIGSLKEHPNHYRKPHILY